MSESDDLLEISRLRELHTAMTRLAEMRDHNGLAFYQPHEKQDAFHAAGACRRRYVRTGNRFGKSTCGVAEDISWCIGERIFYPEGDPRRTVGIPQRSVKGVILVQDWDKADEIFTAKDEGQSKGKIFQLLPHESFVRSEKNQSGHICKIVIQSKWGGHSSIHIDTVKSFLMNPMGQESSDWDFVHVDEPIPKEMWIAHSRGLIDRQGSAWFLCTPLIELWINDYFIPPAKSRTELPDGEYFDFDSYSTWVMTGSCYDNPYNSVSAIREFISNLPPEQIDARVNGRPKQLSGAIHRDFCREDHIYAFTPAGWLDPVTPPPNWTIRLAIDPHPKIPMAVLFAATGPTGHTFIFREIFQEALIHELCSTIHAVLAYSDEEGRPCELPIASAICDPLAWTPNPITGIKMSDAFAQSGIPVVPGSKDLVNGILKTNALFRARDSSGNPMVYVHEDCRQFLFEIDRYVWDTKETKETPNAKCSDHMMENLHRLAVGGFTYLDLTRRLPLFRERKNFEFDLSLPGEKSRSRKPSLSLTKRYLA